LRACLAWASVRECPPNGAARQNVCIRRYENRIVDTESDAGPLRVALWRDKWVLAWRREGSETAEEVFDVFARYAEDLTPPLVHMGMTEKAAQVLANELIAERAVMDREAGLGERVPLLKKAARFLPRRR
jgi:hypothetical protein